MFDFDTSVGRLDTNHSLGVHRPLKYLILILLSSDGSFLQIKTLKELKL